MNELKHPLEDAQTSFYPLSETLTGTQTPAKKLSKLSGVIERVTFHNPDNGWSVLRVAPFDKTRGKLLTVTLYQAQVFAGASMDFYGEYIQHQQYGEQFRAEHAIERKPASVAAIEKYLGSGLIFNVGPVTAKKIVKHFGERTLEVFDQRIEALLEVEGIAKRKLESIKESWLEHQAIRQVMLFLQEYNVSTLFAVKIFKRYGNQAIEIVKQDPYRLSIDIYGIGFFSADRIALALGIERHSPTRIGAAIKHLLNTSSENGHCYLTANQIYQETPTLLGISQTATAIEAALSALLKEKYIKAQELPVDLLSDHAAANQETPLTTNATQTVYYANHLYRDERYVANWVRNRLATPPSTPQTEAPEVIEARIQNWLERYCQVCKRHLSDEQQAAILGIIKYPLSILTGGPGAGKTTTTRTLVRLLRARQLKVTLAAPTGRAAQRMSEVIGYPAKTIHRLLEWDPKNAKFKKDRETPLETDFVIIDETSMLDINLTAALCAAIPDNAQVLFIGDPDQLPSVGAGNVLRELLASTRVPKFALTKVFRQAQKSLIIRYARQINQGFIPEMASPLADPTILQDSGIDCVFFDAAEATQEQLKFIKRVKNLLRYNPSSEAPLASSPESLPLNYLDLQIPAKFAHVNLEQLAQQTTVAEELRLLLKKIPPHSSLHYGLAASDVVKRLYTQTLPKKFGKDVEMQILSPMNRGSLGAYALNQMLQEAANPAVPHKREIHLGERIFREGDRVMQKRNNYDKEVFNGDIGYIQEIDPKTRSCRVCFGKDKSLHQVNYAVEDLVELSLAYAITVHKSQGSEFDVVILPILSQHFKMLFRNLLYTALTRAKKFAVFVGSKQALVLAVKNVDTKKRQTALQYLIDR